MGLLEDLKDAVAIGHRYSSYEYTAEFLWMDKYGRGHRASTFNVPGPKDYTITHEQYEDGLEFLTSVPEKQWYSADLQKLIATMEKLVENGLLVKDEREERD